MNDGRLPPMLDADTRLRRPRAGLQRLIVWHRRLGIAAALLVLLLAVTGLLLNHANRLGLDQTEVSANWLLRWYGYPPVQAPLAFRAGEHWVAWSGTRLYLDAQPVIPTDAAPAGTAVLSDGLMAVAFADALLLLSPQGEVVERIGSESLPGTLLRVGHTGDGRLAVTTGAGEFVADRDLLGWRAGPAAAQWSQPQAAPAELGEALARAERGPGLTAERVLLDLHSGRLLGAWGPWLMDAAALAFIAMAVTGIVFWWKRRRRVRAYLRIDDDWRNPR